MAETNERRKTTRKTTPKPDSQAGAPRMPTSEPRSAPMSSNVHAQHSPDQLRKQIEEAAYYRAKQRGFAPGHELEDWVQAESEVLRNTRH